RFSNQSAEDSGVTGTRDIRVRSCGRPILRPARPHHGLHPRPKCGTDRWLQRPLPAVILCDSEMVREIYSQSVSDIRSGATPMSDDISITTQPRTKLGTSECRRLLRSGRIPANVIGHGEEPQAVSITEDAFRPVLATGHKVVDLTID